MKYRRMPVALVFISFVLLFFSEAHAKQNVMGMIDEAFKRQEISEEDASLYKVYAILDPKKLPYQFKALDSAFPMKDASLVLKNLKLKWKDFSPEVKEKLKPYIFREKNVLKKSYKEKEAEGLSSSGKVVLDSHVHSNWRETKNFNIEWGDDLDAVDGDSNGYPDVVDKWAAYFEKSWTEMVEFMGYRQPKGSDSYLIDVYIANTGGTETLASNIYGFTTLWATTEAGLTDVPFIVVNDTYEFQPGGLFPQNDDPDGDLVGAMKVTAAHEFFHAIHYTLTGVLDSDEDGWWMEASSTWMEDAVFDEVNDYVSYIGGSGGWPGNPNTSLLLFNGGHEYGNVIWAKYLSEYWGGSSAVKSVWDNFTSAASPRSVNAVSAYLNSIGYSLEQAFPDFAIKNLFMDYEEGIAYGSMFERTDISSYPATITSSTLSGKNPDYLGSNYIKFSPASASDISLSFDGYTSFNGTSVDWAVFAAGRKSALYEIFEISLDSDAAGGLDLSAFDEYSSLYLVSAVLSPTGVTPAEDEYISYYDYPNGVPYAFSAALSPSTVLPAAVSGLSAIAPSDGLIELNWSPEAGATGYNIYRTQAGSSGYSMINNSPLISNSFSDSSVTGTKEYSYSVTWLDSSGKESAYSSIVSVTSISSADTDAPLSPVGLSGSEIVSKSLLLSWSANSEPDIKGYNVYYGLVEGSPEFMYSVGNKTSEKIGSLAAGVTYYFSVSAYDDSGNESARSAELEITTLKRVGGGGGGGGCFVATAAYGDYDDFRVRILRNFRDEILMKFVFGRKFVAVYYKYGPIAANIISESGLLRAAAAIMLIPVTGLALLLLNKSAFFMTALTLAYIVYRKRYKGSFY